jgi:hypothetical protein
MKSYFAKLADRATQANPQAPSSVQSRKAFDPFEITSPPQSPLPPIEAARAAGMPGNHSSSLASQTVQAENKLPHFHALEKQQFEAAQAAEPPPSSLASHITSGNLLNAAPGAKDRSLPTPEQEARQEAGIRQANPSTREPSQPEKPPESATLQLTPKQSEDAIKPLEGENSGNDGQRAHMEDEQSSLLRKADDFMQRLTEHLRAPQSASEEIVEAGSQSQATIAPRQDAAPRLLPARSGEPIPERESARPSLVIGKLTVEILPPAPPSIAPLQQVVVVRDVQRGGSGIHSSRRFGLGQF